GAASKPLLPPTKNHEVQFGALCLKMREPSLNETDGALRATGTKPDAAEFRISLCEMRRQENFV
ncbi:MAG: hypothetical protein UV78_C0021G0001, partial [Parcubacteria group bacterium GW2011_GWA2_43_17]